jgi:hypothetical protein
MATVISTKSQSNVHQTSIARHWVWLLSIAGALANVFALIGGSWDGAFHARYIVDTFFSPPHILIYSGMTATMISGLAVLALLAIEGRKHGNGVIAHNPLLLITILANLGFLATAPFDELWHRLFGRDKLTVWTVPHVILNMNLAATAIGVVGLALWLRAAYPNGALSPTSDQTPRRAANVMIFLGLSMFVMHMRGFLTELEAGDTSLSSIPSIGWLYPLVGTLISALCLALATRLLPKHWWLTIALVIVAQLWWAVPGFVLQQFGYTQVDGFRIPLSLAGLLWALIIWAGGRWPIWLHYAAFGAGSIGIMLVAWKLGLLPATTNNDVLVTAIFLPIVAIVGGYAGTGLAGWLQRLAGDDVLKLNSNVGPPYLLSHNTPEVDQ